MFPCRLWFQNGPSTAGYANIAAMILTTTASGSWPALASKTIGPSFSSSLLSRWTTTCLSFFPFHVSLHRKWICSRNHFMQRVRSQSDNMVKKNIKVCIQACTHTLTMCSHTCVDMTSIHGSYNPVSLLKVGLWGITSLLQYTLFFIVV